MSTELLDRLLQLTAERGASDLHLSVGRPPHLRVSGLLDAVRFRGITDGDIESMIAPFTPPSVWKAYLDTGDADFAHEVPGLARFRVNLFRHERGRGAVFRLVPSEVLSFEELGIPAAVRRTTTLDSGLVLVTGPTGSGKSSTLAAILDEINARRPLHIITIEDPVEFVHENRRSLVTQREIGTHTPSFAAGLRMALREDPDAILVGELREREAMSIALDAAQAGLLVLGTLHTASAAGSITRVVSSFPHSEQERVRLMLANVLEAVIAQQLVPRKGGGRVVALEILFGGPGLATPIRENKINLVDDFIQANKARGTVSMDESLRALVENDSIEPLQALDRCVDPEAMGRWLESRGVRVGGTGTD